MNEIQYIDAVYCLDMHIYSLSSPTTFLRLCQNYLAYLGSQYYSKFSLFSSKTIHHSYNRTCRKKRGEVYMNRCYLPYLNTHAEPRLEKQ